MNMTHFSPPQPPETQQESGNTGSQTMSNANKLKSFSPPDRKTS